jgi:hypothetical protein
VRDSDRRSVARRAYTGSLYDSEAWPATTRHKEAEGSAYYRHFYMALREDGSPKADRFQVHAGLGFANGSTEDHRLDGAVSGCAPGVATCAPA